MTKKELLEEFALFEDFESAAATKRAYAHLLSIIKRELVAGNTVALGADFGTLSVSIQSTRTGEMNGKPYSTPAKQVVKFKPSAPMKTLVAGN